MGFKKLILIFSFLLVGCLIMTQVAASDDVAYFPESKNITFEGIDFTIPEGFGESKNAEEFDGLGSEGKTSFYISEDRGEIVITVISDWMGMSLDELKTDNAIKASINGHKGWNYTEKGLHYFGYVHDDKGILVGVTNKTRLYEIIH